MARGTLWIEHECKPLTLWLADLVAPTDWS
jgi:hypothetical protein